MCDDFTRADDDKALAAKGLTRRDFAAMGAGGLALAAMPALAKDRPLTESMVMVPTLDGVADAFFVHPARGRHPAVMLWPDIGGLRETKMAMARRLAAEGFAVLAVNQYYRSARAPVLNSFAEWRTPEGRAKIGPMAAKLNHDAVSRDTVGFVTWLDSQRAVARRRGIGVQGYCMGGPFAVRSAAASPRIRAVASFHGGGLATDKPDSPHIYVTATGAAYLIAVARNDDARNPAEKDTFAAAARAAGRPIEVEVYNADHGWCVPDSPVYDAAEADRAFARLLALYRRL
jgi:carboxymethylenebutenolidase